MSKDELLRELDGLKHADRLKRAAQLARTLVDDPARGALLDALYADASYHPRLIAVLMADVAGDVPRLRAAREDSSRIVRRMAAEALIRHDQDAQALADWFLSADGATRLAARGHLLRRRRRDVARLLVEPLMERGEERDAAAFVLLCGVAMMESVVASLEPHAVSWAHVAQGHLPLAHRQLERALAQAQGDSARVWIWWAHVGTTQAMAQRDPDALLALLHAYGPEQVNQWLMPTLCTLARRAPEGFVGWLLSERARQWPATFIARATKSALLALPRAAHVTLVKRQLRAPHGLARLLKALPPSARGEVFDAALDGEDGARMVWPDELLEVLPHEVRQREAARMAALREIREVTARHAQVVAFLDTAPAREVLTPLSRGSTAEDRAQGVALLVHNARRARRGMAEVVDLLAPRLKNDQDPVRMAATQALGAVPGQMFEAEAAPGLLAIVKAVVEARDTSWGTRYGCAQLAHKLLRAHAAQPTGPQFMAGLTILRELAGQGGALDLPYGLFHGMKRGVERAMIDAVLPWLKAGGERSYWGDALRLATLLGDRGWDIAPLQAMLEDAIWATPSHAATALPLWLADPKTRDARVVKLLGKDRSTVVFEPVWRHLHTRRQDLLDPFIQGAPLGGRFAPSKAGWVFPARDGFVRWLPRQQAALARVLRLVVADKKHQSWERTNAVTPLAAMPIHGPADLLDLVRSSEVPICEAALGALIWTDRPDEALEILLDYVDGDRARVAMYAVPRVAAFISEARLLREMERLVTRERVKVTVMKEALRLIGGAGGEDAARLVAQVWRTPKLHRDARIAALHAARSLLDHPSAWQMLEDAAVDAEEYAALALLEAQPLGMETRHRARYTGVLIKLAAHPLLRVRAAFFGAMARPAYGVGDWLEYGADAVAPAAQAALLDMDNTLVWRAAMSCLIELLVRSPGRVKPLHEALRALVERAEAELQQPAPGVERDLPATQRLHALIALISQQSFNRRAVMGAALERLADLLVSPRWAVQRAALLLAAARPDDAATAARVEGVLAGPLLLAQRAAVEQRCAQALADLSVTGDPAAHLPALDLLIRAERPAARRVAVAALELLSGAHLWAAPWTERLARLRMDRDEEVAALACAVFVRGE